MNYNLNQGQKDASEAFFSFLFSPDKEFIISGPAGVGKTYLMNYIVDNTMPRYMDMCKLLGIEPDYTSVDMTATTNKAAEVLATATNRPTSTIHSFLNLRVQEDYSTGRSNLIKTRNWVVHQNKIIFIDECSMIDSALYKVILEGTNNCKIIYVGDHSQLAPVSEKLSPIYRQGSPMFTLTEQMRTSIPELQLTNQQLRETVASDQFKPIKIYPGIIDHLDDVAMQAEIQKIFKNQTTESRILAYTNRRVMEFNDHIRGIRSLPVEFTVGEILVNSSAIKIGDRSIAVEEEVTVLKNHGLNPVILGRNPDGSDIILNVNHLDISTKIGGVFHLVPVPMDMSHYHELCKYYSRKKHWDMYFTLKQKYPDLRQRDAATVHKSQGSTYDSVFIDLGNISTCTHKDQAARMLYVAFSRARHRVFLYGQLAPKYGGLLI